MTQPVENKQSRLLTYEENQQIIKLLGTSCQSLVTSVAQLFETQAPAHSQWIRKDAGVLCFVKDNHRKNYFFRIYCIKRNKIIWEHELYNNMEYIAPCPFLHTFEAEECMACFNFANEDEAKEMKTLVEAKLLVKRRREAKRLRNANSTPHIEGRHKNKLDPLTTSSADVSISKGKRRRNITKADIGNPLEFRHVSHVGWHPDKGFAVSTEDTALTELFAKAGISEKELKDKNTRDFIYDFISKHDQQNIITDEQVSKARRPPPKVPSPPTLTSNAATISASPAPPAATGLAGPPVPPRGSTRSTHNRVAPPPPPSVTQATPQHVVHNNVPPPRPPTTPKVSNLSKQIPPPPPSNAPAPPPPPMLPVADAMSLPPPPIPTLASSSELSQTTQPDGRSALLESIRSGATLRPVVPEADKRCEDARGDLLSEIRKGFQLKPATEREVKPISPGAEQQHNGVNDLAAALSRALAERNRVIHPDDDSESSDSNDDWDD